jgi:hypothetical protein
VVVGLEHAVVVEDDGDALSCEVVVVASEVDPLRVVRVVELVVDVVVVELVVVVWGCVLGVVVVVVVLVVVVLDVV